MEAPVNSPAGVVVRVAVPTDAARVRALLESALDPVDTRDADGLHRVLWQSEEVDGFVAVADDVVVGVGFGSIGAEDGVASGFVTALAVHPDYRRRGLGTALLREVEGSLRARSLPGVRTGGGQPHFWWSGIPAGNSDAIGFFRNQGYIEEDQTFNMRVDLAAALLDPDPCPAALVHRIGDEEWPAFQHWMERTWKYPWSVEVQRTRERSPTACFVAVRDGEILGFAAYDTNRLGLFGPMGTSPTARGSGLGGELLRCCLRDYVTQGRETCEIGWVGPLGFYQRTVGATVSDRFVRLHKDFSGQVIRP
jgi:predicted N-acetyltransferase YhbS